MLDTPTERKKLNYSLRSGPHSGWIFWPSMHRLLLTFTNPQSFNEIKRKADKYEHGYLVLIRQKIRSSFHPHSGHNCPE